jgi:hypothetical protein
MSETTQPATFSCSACGRRYPWKAELAGKRARCRCGAGLDVPSGPSANLYELRTHAPQPRRVMPVSGDPRDAGPVLDYQDRRAAKAGARTADGYFPNPLIDLKLPLILIASGVLVQFLAGWWSGSYGGQGAAESLMAVGIDLFAGTVVMLIAVLIAVKYRGIRIGRFWTAVLKLSAVAIAPSAAMTLLNVSLQFFPMGWIVAFALAFCFYFALLGVFFDLDESETWYCVSVIFIVKVAVVLGLWALMP